MRKVFSLVTVVSLLGLSICSNNVIAAMGIGGDTALNSSTHHHGMPQEQHGMTLGDSMECCAVVSSGLILPDNLSYSAYFALMFFVLVYRFLVPPKILLPVYHPPRP